MDAEAKRPNSPSAALLTLPGRLAMLAALFFLEKFALNFLVDFDAAQAAKEGLGLFIRLAQHDVLRFLVTLAMALAVLGYVRYPSLEARGWTPMVESKPQTRWLLAHLLLFLPLLPLSYALYRSEPWQVPFAWVAGLWMVFAALAGAAAFRAMATWAEWWRAACSLGELWVYSSIAAAAATAAMHWVQTWWAPTAKLTFSLVAPLLRPLLPTLQADPIAMTLATSNFAVQIADQCSGLEGLGLMLVFASTWLLLFRREYRFPRALLLIPIGLILVFALNVVRIAALVMIGNAGHPAVAIYGFHSQAGWIGFNCAAVGVVLLSRRIAWLNHGDGVARETSSNPTAAYLMPFLAVLIAGTLAHAMSSGFEILYPLRFIAALAALAWYRKALADLNYRCTWRGPLIGVMVFVLWMAAARYRLAPAGLPAGLADLSAPARAAWTACRAAAAIVTVPIVEELAYRGFLMRRWLSAEFETVSFSAVRWPQLLLTSLLFGAAHGAMWLPGVIAGVLYGGVLIRTGRMGESIAAHATTNALIVACVLFGGQWQLW
jgi:exosortase E/protease (VPEID-CTERM system)